MVNRSIWLDRAEREWDTAKRLLTEAEGVGAGLTFVPYLDDKVAQIETHIRLAEVAAQAAAASQV